MTSARWPALVLAAGLGTRLAPLSALRAKAALPVAGRPLILRILDWLRAGGVTRVVINLHHRAETVTRLVGDGSGCGLEVRYSWERQVLGSGGGPARALPLLAADRFFIVNGDTLADVDLEALALSHERTGARATLAVAPADLVKYNALMADAGHRMTGSVMRGTPPGQLPEEQSPWHFVGVQAVDAAALAQVSPDAPSDILRGVYPRLLETDPDAVRVFPETGAFFDIGTPADYLETARYFARRPGGRPDRGTGCVVEPSAMIEDAVLWDRVHVGAGARLSRCVVTDDVVIPPGVRYDRAVITRDGMVPL